MVKRRSAVLRGPGYMIGTVLIYLFVVVSALLCLMPFLHVLAKSISSEALVAARKIVLIPGDITFNAYRKILADPSILQSMFISIVMTVVFTALGLVLTVLAAYPLSRSYFKGRRMFSFLIMFTYYFAAGIIPEYLLMSALGLLENFWGLVLPLAFSPWNLLIMKTSLASSFPESLEESARIDGASYFRILWQIVLPLSLPILTTIGLFLAVGRWNAYQDALFYIKQRTDLRPIQLKLYYLVITATESFQSAESVVTVQTNPDVLKSACVMFATLPIVCVYPFVQKYFVHGIMIGAVKG
ncbi:MAG: carbohydrate ABC transporter permease [Clostridiales bacterium]|nr:carbohydrate ABC transporter permease [Clostridiales bacterium]